MTRAGVKQEKKVAMSIVKQEGGGTGKRQDQEHHDRTRAQDMEITYLSCSGSPDR